MTAPATRPQLAVLATLFTLMVVGCADASVSQESTVLIQYQRSGGISGVEQRLAIDSDGRATLTVDGDTSTITIDADGMKRLLQSIQDAEFGNLESEYLPQRPGADMYEYTITYDGHTVRAKETALPKALRPIVELLDAVLGRA